MTEQMLRQYTVLVEYLGATLGPDYEVVLHEILPETSRVAAIANGSISPYAFLMDKINNIEITPAQLALDPCTGSCVITDVKTGQLKALVSYPGYDNNKLANTVDADYYQSLREDKSNPLWNYATQEQTAPGSTFKMVSICLPVAAAI